MGKKYEEGWRSISEYTGASCDEIAEAISTGELRCQVRAIRRHLDNWVRSRSQAAFARVRDESVELVS